jgi:glycosyltransferase involved in cell wall biosynthesis
MKITIVTPVFPYPIRGKLQGVERFVENIAFPLKKLGYSIKIVTTFRNGGKKYDIHKGIPILRISDSQRFLGKFGSLFYLNYITFGFNLLRKKHYQFYGDSDILIFTAVILNTNFFRKRNIPVITIFFHYDLISSFKDYFTYPILHFLQKRQFRKLKHVVTISDSSKRDLLNNYNVEEKNVGVFKVGIDIEKFTPKNESHDIRKRFGKNILLFSAIMIPRKRVPILLEAMTYVIRYIPDAHLILTGEGPMWNYCKNLAITLNLQKNTTFLGFIDDKSYLQYLASCDIFVFPSEKEGFGQVILEAMASGTPAICANKPPMSDILGNGGLTFKVNDSKDLAEKIIYLLNNRDELSKLKVNAMNIIKNYTWENIVKTYVDHLNSIKETKNKF